MRRCNFLGLVLQFGFATCFRYEELQPQFRYEELQPQCGDIQMTLDDILYLSTPHLAPGTVFSYGEYCTWTIISPANTKIKIIFENFVLEYHPTCAIDYVTISNGNCDNEDSGGPRFCGVVPPPASISATNVICLKFASSMYTTQKGFILKAESITGVDKKPTTVSGTTTAISPTTPKLTTGTLSSLSVIRILHSLYSSLSLTHHTKVVFASAFGSTTTILANKQSLYSTSVPNFPTEKIDMCSVEKLTIYKSITVLSPKDNDTRMYPTSIICGLTIISKSSALHIEFEQFDVEYQQHCMWDYLEIYDGPSAESPLKSRYCGSDIPSPIQTSGNEVSFRFQSDHIIPRSGFKLNVSLISNSPGLDEQTSEFMQTSLDTYSPLFSVRSRSTTVSSSNKPTIAATPAQFSMEPLTLATPSQVLKEPSDVSTTATSQSDEISAPSLESINICSRDEVFVTDNTTVTSPNFPSNYPVDTKCGLHLSAVSGKVLSIEFVHFDLEYHGQCLWDHLSVYNGNSDSSPLVGTFCGTDLPSSVVSSTNNVFVKFVSDSFTSNSGFQMTVYVDDSINSATRVPKPESSIQPGSTILSGQTSVKVKQIITAKIIFSTEKFIPYESSITPNLSNNSSKTNTSVPFSGRTKIIGDEIRQATTKEFVWASIDVNPNKHSSTDVLTANNQSSTEAVTPNNQGSSEAVTPNNQDSTEFVTPDNQSSTEALIPNNQGSSVAVTPNKQSSTESVTTHNQSSTESVTTNNQSFTDTYKHATTPVTNSSQTTIGISYTQSTTPSLGFGLPQACSGDGMIIRNSSGIIESPGLQSNKKYPHSVNCTWIILGLTGNRISVHFKAFELEESNNCSKDSITVYKNTIQDSNLLSRYCGLLEPFEIYTMEEKLLIHFSADEDGSERGFMATYTVETPPVKIADCPVWQRACNEGTCISEEWFCDSIEDCAGGEDEENCAKCSDTQFQCDYNRCIAANQRCNGIHDCQDKKDEDFCVSITNGSLRIMYKNKWYPVCGVGWTTALGHALCKMAEYREMASVSFLPLKVNTTMILINSISNIYQNIEISGKCPDAGEVNLICKESGCGTVSTGTRKARVVGGYRSATGEWPWVVAIRAGEKVTCGGTLISNQWVATAGHCMASLQDSTHLASVMVGTNAVMTDDSYTVGVTEIVMHPDYEFIYNADLALLRLQRPLVISNNVRPVCLPWDRRHFTNSTLCYIAGWGITDMKDYYTTTAPEYLHHARTKIWIESDCRKVYSKKVKDSMFCAGYKAGGIDACKGDSGGPLMCQIEDNRWVLTGVTSWGEKCGQPGLPGVYTDVASYLDWIDSVMGDIVENVSCDFESVNICGYMEMSNGSFLWTRRPGGFSSDIKPSVDATTNGINGHYVFAEVSPGQTCNNNHAVLLSPLISGERQKCLRFAFMFSGRSDLVLSVYGHRGDYNETGLHEEAELLWVMRSEFSTWRRSKISLPANVTHVMFVVTLGIKTNVGVALDDVFIESSPCADQDAFRCSFDDGTLCQYQQATDDYLDWVLQSTATQNGYKVIPKSSWSGYYLEFGGSQIARGDKATFLSTTINDSLPHCLNMYYKIYPRLSGSLSVILRVEFGDMHVYGDAMWTTSESRMNTWTWVAVDLPSRMYDFRVAIQGKRESYKGDFEIIVDDMYIYEGNCRVT